MAKNASATVTIVVKPTAAGTLTNTASVSANENDPDSSNNSATESTTVDAPARMLTSLSPAKLFIGQNGTAKKLKYDVLAEVLVNGNVVGSGQLNGVKAGGTLFTQAALDTIALSLPVPAAANPAATLAIRVSVRISCLTATSSVSTKARLWYNGRAIDSGTTRDAGSRFDATIGGANSNYFLRTPLALATTAGTSRQFIDAVVNNSSACPGRTFTPFGTWSETLP